VPEIVYENPVDIKISGELTQKTVCLQLVLNCARIARILLYLDVAFAQQQILIYTSNWTAFPGRL